MRPTGREKKKGKKENEKESEKRGKESGRQKKDTKRQQKKHRYICYIYALLYISSLILSSYVHTLYSIQKMN